MATLLVTHGVEEGRRYVVDVDLEKFFDRVNHDVLMGRLAKRIEDKRMLRLIRRYLEEGPRALEERSRRPHSSPNQTPRHIVEALLEVRRRLGYGLGNPFGKMLAHGLLKLPQHVELTNPVIHVSANARVGVGGGEEEVIEDDALRREPADRFRAIREAAPEKAVLTCHDEYLLHTIFDVDGLLVGYGGIAPELLVEFIAAGKAKDYPEARRIHDTLLPVTKNVYHRGSHMEGTVALKLALVERGKLEHAAVRPPLLPLAPEAQGEISLALKHAGII